MRVRMLTSIAGAIDAAPGDVVEVDAGTAARLIERGLPEPVLEAPETAALEPPERAVRPRARPRKGA